MRVRGIAVLCRWVGVGYIGELVRAYRGMVQERGALRRGAVAGHAVAGPAEAVEAIAQFPPQDTGLDVKALKYRELAKTGRVVVRAQHRGGGLDIADAFAPDEHSELAMVDR